jgi:hypothetical protein
MPAIIKRSVGDHLVAGMPPLRHMHALSGESMSGAYKIITPLLSSFQGSFPRNLRESIGAFVFLEESVGSFDILPCVLVVPVTADLR